MHIEDELLDIVDENDEVIGQDFFSIAHEKGLLHRGTSIIIANSNGEVLLSQRSAKISYPLLFGASAGGHVKSDQTYDDCAAQELKEELGISPDLRLLGKHHFNIEKNNNEFLSLYFGVYDGDISPCEDEVAQSVWFTQEQVKTLIEELPQLVTPQFRVIWGYFDDHLKQEWSK